LTHGYETGRLDLPFTGIATFARAPHVPDWDAIEAHVAILGAPLDSGTQWRPGARFGPRAVREASTLFSFGHAGAYDHEDDATYLEGVRIVGMGDADIVHIDHAASLAAIGLAVRKALAAGALAVTVGGDHSVTSPCVEACDRRLRALHRPGHGHALAWWDPPLGGPDARRRPRGSRPDRGAGPRGGDVRRRPRSSLSDWL
jgi:agmatinase